MSYSASTCLDPSGAPAYLVLSLGIPSNRVSCVGSIMKGVMEGHRSPSAEPAGPQDAGALPPPSTAP
eukprot:13153630-Heterocapsa_arctica.AAC.1